MKTAIIYYSMGGNTKLAAEKIAKQIEADIISIEPEKAYPDKGLRKFIWGGKSAVMGEKPQLLPYEFDGEKYERIILGTPVWASSFAPPIRTFVEENKEALKGKKLAVFTCFSGGGADKAIDKLKQYLDITEFEAELILVDPKDKPSEENESKINAFCSALS